MVPESLQVRPLEEWTDIRVRKETVAELVHHIPKAPGHLRVQMDTISHCILDSMV